MRITTQRHHIQTLHSKPLSLNGIHGCEGFGCGALAGSLCVWFIRNWYANIRRCTDEMGELMLQFGCIESCWHWSANLLTSVSIWEIDGFVPKWLRFRRKIPHQTQNEAWGLFVFENNEYFLRCLFRITNADSPCARIVNPPERHSLTPSSSQVE